MTFDDVAQYLTKKERLRLDAEQRTLAYYRNVNSVGKDAPGPPPASPQLRGPVQPSEG